MFKEYITVQRQLMTILTDGKKDFQVEITLHTVLYTVRDTSPDPQSPSSWGTEMIQDNGSSSLYN